MRIALPGGLGRGLARRVLSASMLTLAGFGGGQVLRLIGNLALTRLLVPEAFGLMMLITVLIIGLRQFSDIGIGQSIMRSPRGDDPLFLDTAWSLELIRNAILWLLAVALAWPMAAFYDIPALTQLVPVTALVLIIGGFEPTRVDTAGRHLMLGRITAFDLLGQVLAMMVTIWLAWLTGSVWALVIGQIAGTLIRLALMSWGLPGAPNRFRLERSAMQELVTFGKWIFLSTVAGFAISQGDKLVLSKFLGLEMLGIYNIGYFLAAAPSMLSAALVGRLMIPLYRERPPAASRANFRALRKFRLVLTAALLAIAGLLALSGVWLVGILYDPRYAHAGAVVVLLSLAFMPQLITQSYDQIALTVGASRAFFLLLAARGVLMLLCVLIGVQSYGLLGAIVGQGVAIILSYPLIVALAARYGAWDPLHDVVMGIVAVFIAAAALTINMSAIALLT